MKTSMGVGDLELPAPSSFLTLESWGWDEGWARAFEPFAGELEPGRIIAQHRGSWIVAGSHGERSASLTGRFRHEIEELDWPAVGDWVGLSGSAGHGRIDAVLPRRSTFLRRSAGSRVGAQVIAANVDTLFVATSLNADLSERRLERYVSMARESGAEPVVLLTKADLVGSAERVIERLSVRLRVDVCALSAHSGEGVESVGRWFAPGRTLALVGSSGVGKSTLLNRLAGTQLMATLEIREDDARGRHATTHRELFKLPGGALMLDTPGMRELGLWEADEGLDGTFSEIVELAAGCRFGDCSHVSEPGCAVLSAIAEGRLDRRRLNSYRRLQRELAETPTPLRRRELDRKFSKMVRNVAAETYARKKYPGG